MPYNESNMGKMERLKELEEMASKAVKCFNKDEWHVIDDTSDSMIDDVVEYGNGICFVRYELFYGFYPMDLEIEYLASFDGEQIDMKSYDSVVHVYTSDEDQELGLDEVVSFQIDFLK